jgi:hypothetical protein
VPETRGKDIGREFRGVNRKGRQEPLRIGLETGIPSIHCIFVDCLIGCETFWSSKRGGALLWDL